MAERAQVTSIEAIEAFRAALLVYVSKARILLDQVCDEVTRTRMWLETEQRVRWENELRRRTKELERAQEAFFSASMAHLRQATTVEKEAVQRAKRRVTEAEGTLNRVKTWNREFDNAVAAPLKQLDALRTLFSSHLPKGAAHLAVLVRTLDQYLGTAPPTAGPSPEQAPEGQADTEATPTNPREEQA